MTANASKNKETANTLMSPAAGKISEAVLMLMQLFGIQKIECKKLRVADFERLVADIKNFEGVPKELTSCSVLVKNSLAEILATAGVVALDITASEEESKMLSKSYDTLIAINNAVTAGSGDVQDPTDIQATSELPQIVAAEPAPAPDSTSIPITITPSEEKKQTEPKKQSGRCKTRSCCRMKK